MIKFVEVRKPYTAKNRGFHCRRLSVAVLCLRGVRFMKKITALFLTALLLVSLCPFASALGYDVVSTPQFNMAETFESSVTKVSKNSKWALADTSGIAITGYNWDAMGDIVSEYIPAKKGDLWGYITPSGSVRIPYQFAMAGSFNDGVAMVQKADGSYAYIDKTGKILFASPFTYSFSPSGGAICGMVDGLYGYCDTEGNMIIPPKFDMAFDFHEGYAAVKSGEKWGYITSYGSYSVRPAYDYAGDFKNGHAICRLSGKYGIINTADTKTAPFQFDYIGTPDDSGRYPAKAGTVSGYINASGEWILKTAYDFCYTYTSGVARVYQDGKWGYINEEGVEVVPPTFADCGEYHNGRAPFSLDGSLWGYLSLDLSASVFLPDPVPEPEPEPEPVPVPEPEPEPTTPTTTVPVAQNPAADGAVPLAPDSENCISMKIDSNIARSGTEEITLSEPPVLLNGTTMIPVRNVIELLGGTIAWNAENQRIIINRNYISVSMTIGSRICYINGVPGYLTAAPVIVNGSTLVPLRSVTDALGCTIKWIDMHQNIYIYY